MERLRLLPAAQEYILKQADGKARLLKSVAELSKAFALASSHDDALDIRIDVAFFQTVRAALVKTTTTTQRAADELDHAIRQIVSQAVATDEVIDLFSAAGLKKPDISILSDEFLAEVRSLPQKNLAVELLRKLLNDEIETRSRRSRRAARWTCASCSASSRTARSSSSSTSRRCSRNNSKTARVPARRGWPQQRQQYQQSGPRLVMRPDC